MAFWGVEVKPAKPYAHDFDQSRGRLRISQATLGDGKSTSKSTVQCNFHNRSPVLLCNLIPNVTETCHLELEFEEDEEVIFSVLGQRSVHLTGYYIGHVRSLDEDDVNGEDIAESDTSDSYSYDSDDDYESDFIDDSEVAVYTGSSVRKNNVVIEEIEDDDKQHDGIHNFRRLKKKHVVSDSEDTSDYENTETVFKHLVVKNNETTKEESEDEHGFPICFPVESKSSKKKIKKDKKRKIGTIINDSVSVSASHVDHDSTVLIESGCKYNEKPKKKKENDEKHFLESENKVKQDQPKENACIEKESETGANLLIKGNAGRAKEIINEAEVTNIDLNNTLAMSGEPDNCKQSKKKSKKRRVKVESMSDENNSCKEGKIDNDTVPNVDIKPLDNSASTAENALKKNKKNKKNKDTKMETLAYGKTDQVSGVDDLQHRSQPIKTRTFPNGLIVEEVFMGKPDGKKASPGKKVSVWYIGKLKNGTIFDSNIGRKPFKFRLGIGEVIKGWDIGVGGMRVGDKRRLTVPPSFGYGEKAVGKIPPNSWLVFDVELVDVL